jgi:hypothetical protein
LSGTGYIEQIPTSRQFDRNLRFRGRKAKQTLERPGGWLRMRVKIEQNDGACFIWPSIGDLIYKAGDAFLGGRRKP